MICDTELCNNMAYKTFVTSERKDMKGYICEHCFTYIYGQSFVEAEHAFRDLNKKIREGREPLQWK